MSSVIKVGIAELNTAIAPERIRTSGLGSCVGVTLYDPKMKLAGLAHVMLPTSQIAKNGDVNVAKYADTAIPELINRLVKLGSRPARLEAKMAGGAQMFAFASASEMMRIGPRNVEACKRILTQFNIRIVAEDTGGNCGRTIELDANTGVLMIRTVNQGIKEV
jgi:chemotaxis protein CheD